LLPVKRDRPARSAARALVRGAIAAAAVVVIAVVFWRIGWPGIRANLLLIGPWFFGLLLLNVVAQGAFVLGLRTVLPRDTPGPSFGRLYAIYLTGDAASYVAPASGEALKVHLLGEHGGKAAATAAVTLHKQADLLAQCIFAFFGIGVALWRFDLPRAVAWSAAAGAAVLFGLLLLMTWALARGAFSPILRRLVRFRPLSQYARRFEDAALAVDARIRAFHAERRASFVAAVAACLAGWCGGFFETWIVLALLAPGTGWSTALAIETLAMVLNNALLFVPGKLGGAEAVRTGLFVLLGLTAAQGAASALVRRTRELLWVLPGWLLLSDVRIPGLEKTS
jgi:uncharacterized protein (TIRG00374 family)